MNMDHLADKDFTVSGLCGGRINRKARNGKTVRLICLARASLVKLYGIPVHNSDYMDTISVNKFRDNLKSVVEQVVSRHEPLKVTRRAGEDFVVLSAEDWEREQETLSVLQNRDLMQQIAASLETHKHSQGYKPTKEQMDEITGI
ncbi:MULTISPECIES: type II toxin-antitoxin system Phd/YefM family antitoxin [unclassified Oceanobacter]|uniref:type II toxin-antitoxin system Phd/YefM family antitoxin n=2 Tax=unclassified Oceanobacter TaxID=2620260 RepID=UPI002733A870|nr:MULTISPECIES: type II toxin-antitoxin system Phd/YefM family antitoxin [unclassified Oceanobacter]MDP2609018.1 type II toxin-antitoxin system Phd/YefM family antitoxin [Oceanobacter sp. 1_MG-2023]MDP2611997.1 type II toxin-antitoxin system Phd/YefM family antitoxin [Oceanobacter sp. 2_MG-2023]